MRPELCAAERVVTATEYDVLQVREGGAGSYLSTAEAAILLRVGEFRPGFCTQGHRSIRLGSYAGIVSLGNRALEVLPKIDGGDGHPKRRAALIRMLQTAGDHPVFRQMPLGQQTTQTHLLEVFIAAFLDEVSMVVRGGLLRSYVEREEDIGVVRGRIDVARQIQRLGNRPDVVACRFDELADDNAWNRLVKRGLTAVGPWIESANLERQWRELMFVFAEVPETRRTPLLPDRLFLDRRASRYRAVIEWIRWILAFEGPSLRSGERKAPGLLFDLNGLFQATVGGVLRREARKRPGVRVREQARGYLGQSREAASRRVFPIRPDFLVEAPSGLTLVADAKWKRLDSDSGGAAKPAIEDVYQIHAYASALGCNRVALVYPWHEGLRGLRTNAFSLPEGRAGCVEFGVAAIDVYDESFATRTDGTGWFSGSASASLGTSNMSTLPPRLSEPTHSAPRPQRP